MRTFFSVVDRLQYAGGVLWVDNVTLNSGTGGATCAADDIGGIHYQRVKLGVGADGTANDAIPVSNGMDSASAGILAAGIVGQLDDTATGAVTENQFAPVRISSRRALLVEGVASGTVIPVSDGGGTLTVDGTVAVTGVATEAKQDTIIGHVDGIEALLTTIDTDTGNIAINTSNSATALQIMDDWDNAASDGASVSGDVAHDAIDAGEPVKIGAKASTAPSGVTAVANGDRTNLLAGADGILIVRPYCALEDIVSGVDTDTAGDSTAVIAAPGVGIRLYITSVIVKNTHASTDAYVDIRDGAAGSVLATIPAPAVGGAVVNFPVPLRLTANTACAVDPSAAVSTIITTVVGFKAAV